MVARLVVLRIPTVLPVKLHLCSKCERFLEELGITAVRKLTSDKFSSM